MDNHVAAIVVQEDSRRSPSACVHVVDDIAVDLRSLAIDADGVDGGAVGRLKHDVVDRVIGDRRVRSFVVDAVAPGIVDRVVRHGRILPVNPHGGGVDGAVIYIVDHVVGDGAVVAADVHPVAGTVGDGAVFQRGMGAQQFDAPRLGH